MYRFKKVFFNILFTAIIVSTAFASTNNLMSLQVKKGHLRSMPSFLGEIVAALDYGDRVEVIEERKPWLKVQSIEKKNTGWLHDSALTYRKIVLNPGAADVEQAATSDELALAGKGFNKQVEGEFKAKNPHLDYSLIDSMEQVVVSQAQIEQFIQEGELSPKGVIK